MLQPERLSAANCIARNHQLDSSIQRAARNSIVVGDWIVLPKSGQRNVPQREPHRVEKIPHCTRTVL